MFSITFQGLCGIAQRSADLGSDVYLPFCQPFKHTAVLVAPAAAVHQPPGVKLWEPDGVGLDSDNTTVCFWFLHGPKTRKIFGSGRRLALIPLDGTVSRQPAAAFMTGQVVPLASVYNPMDVHSTDSRLGDGTRIGLPNGYVVGDGPPAEFALIDASHNVVAPGPFSERMVWRPISTVPPTSWMLGNKKKVIVFKRKDDGPIDITITNAMPVIAEADVADHFAGMYEAVLTKRNGSIPKAMRFALEPIVVVKNPDEGVNCIPPGETPPSDDPTDVGSPEGALLKFAARLQKAAAGRRRVVRAPARAAKKLGGMKK